MALDALLVFLRTTFDSRPDVDRIFQVSKSFTEINEAEIDEKYL